MELVDIQQDFIYHHSAVRKFFVLLNEIRIADQEALELSGVVGLSADIAGDRLRKLAKAVYDQVKNTLNPEEDLCQKLRELKIKRRKGAVETNDTGSARLTKEQLLNIYGKLITSKFTLAEVTKIKENWKRFIQRYGLDNPLFFVNLKKGGAGASLGAVNLHRFKMFLSHGLPYRGLHAVYTKWVSLFCCHRKGRFSEPEVQLMKELLPLCEGDSRLTRVNTLMLALQRSRKSIITKLKELEASPPPESLKWTRKQEEILVNKLCEELGAKSLEDLKAPVSGKQWMAVADQIGVAKQQAYNHWHYHLVPALMATKWQTRAELEIHLIKRLKKMVDKGQVTDWREVDWRKLAHRLGGYGPLYVYRMVMTMRWNYIKQKTDRDIIQECINKLYPLMMKKRSPTKERTTKGIFIHSPVRNNYLRRAEYDFTTHTLYNQ